MSKIAVATQSLQTMYKLSIKNNVKQNFIKTRTLKQLNVTVLL